MILKKLLSILFIVALPVLGLAQGIVTIGIPHSTKKQKTQKARPHANARKQPLPDTIQLPFWEDFSTTSGTVVDSTRWFWGQSVRVSDGMAIRPPSLKVATFDGVDSIGKPYNPNDVLAKGYADKLVSQAIDLTIVDPAERSTVYLSYMYQMKGNGEIPDASDRLLVLFLTLDNEWIPVDTIENDGSLDPTLFYSSTVAVDDERFFHEGFKFRIQNFARLSGPYDAWHVDYIYLNKGGPFPAKQFPDRTISEPLTSLFGIYRSIPIDHFRVAGASVITPPTIVATNLRSDQTGGLGLAGQNVAPVHSVNVTYTEDDTVDELPTYGPVVSPDAEPIAFQEFFQFVISDLPDLSAIPATATSADIEIIVGTTTNDNVIEAEEEGDYDPAIWSPIDFRVNDTTLSVFNLGDKYAYDDGVAEYGAGLNQPGAQIAYEYRLVGVKEENITFLEMYFPRFGDESSQVIEVRIWDELSAVPLYSEITELVRSEDNLMWQMELKESVHVDSIFYIGWRQSVPAVIAAGLDKNNDTGDRMWYNTSGTWEKNTLIHGSLMLRPIFGEGRTVVGVEDERELAIYPNPSQGTFYFTGVAEMLSVYDMTGRSIMFSLETTTSETKLQLPNAAQGIYIIKAHIDGLVRTAKVMVR